MIRYDVLRKMDADLARREGPLDHDRALLIFAGLWSQAVALGVLPPSDPLDGIQSDLAVARILNSCSRS